MALILQENDNVRLTAFAREVPQRTDAILANYLPDTMVRTRTYQIDITHADNNGRAQFRAYDTPVETTSRPAGEKRTGMLPPLGEAMILSENDRLGIYDLALQGQLGGNVQEQIFDDTARLVKRVQNSMEWARGQVLSTGALQLVGENGLNLSAPMGVPAANLPGGDATTTAAVAYSDPSADILGAWWLLQERSRDETGKSLQSAICSSQVMRQMALNLGVRSALPTNRVNDLASDAAVQSVFEAHGLPRPVRYDYQVAGQRVIPADRVVMLPAVDADEFGRTEWGTTAEALEIGMAQGQAAGMVALVMKSEEPVQIKTKVAAIGMPVLNDPRCLYVVDTTP